MRDLIAHTLILGAGLYTPHGFAAAHVDEYGPVVTPERVRASTRPVDIRKRKKELLQHCIERVDVLVPVHGRLDARVLQHRHVVHRAHGDGHRVRVPRALGIRRGLQPEHERVVPGKVGVRRVPEKRVPGGVRARGGVGGFGASAQNLNLAVRRRGDHRVTQRGQQRV